MNFIKKCNICKMEIFSDARNNTYCKLCGMLIDNNSIIKKIKGNLNYFCCKTCMKIFFSFKFNKYGSIKNETI